MLLCRRNIVVFIFVKVPCHRPPPPTNHFVLFIRNDNESSLMFLVLFKRRLHDTLTDGPTVVGRHTLNHVFFLFCFVLVWTNIAYFATLRPCSWLLRQSLLTAVLYFLTITSLLLATTSLLDCRVINISITSFLALLRKLQIFLVKHSRNHHVIVIFFFTSSECICHNTPSTKYPCQIRHFRSIVSITTKLQSCITALGPNTRR